MKVIVTGGRDYDNEELLNLVLLRLNPSVIIQGGATGADLRAKEFAKRHNKEMKEYKADWNKYGNRAGPIRNKLMLKENASAIVVAFEGGSGTANCVKEAVKLGRVVLKVQE